MCSVSLLYLHYIYSFYLCIKNTETFEIKGTQALFNTQGSLSFYSCICLGPHDEIVQEQRVKGQSSGVNSQHSGWTAPLHIKENHSLQVEVAHKCTSSHSTCHSHDVRSVTLHLPHTSSTPHCTHTHTPSNTHKAQITRGGYRPGFVTDQYQVLRDLTHTITASG